MSHIDTINTLSPNTHPMRFRQLCAIIRIEVQKTLFSKQAGIAYVLSIVPIVLLILMGGELSDYGKGEVSIDFARRSYGYLYSTLILGGVVFLGSAAIFTSLFRGEILNCSMHYYLLSPLRREILVVGKYLAGLLSVWLLFGLTTAICYLLIYLAFGLTWLINDISNGVAVVQMFTYTGITLLACVGYGSLFMATGLIFRNPFIPVALIACWEVIHFVLPHWLKLFSVIHYLKGMLPVPITEGPLAVTVTPPSVSASIGGILLLTLISIVITIIYLNRYEIRYTED